MWMVSYHYLLFHKEFEILGHHHHHPRPPAVRRWELLKNFSFELQCVGVFMINLIKYLYNTSSCCWRTDTETGQRMRTRSDSGLDPVFQINKYWESFWCAAAMGITVVFHPLYPRRCLVVGVSSILISMVIPILLFQSLVDNNQDFKGAQELWQHFRTSFV